MDVLKALVILLCAASVAAVLVAFGHASRPHANGWRHLRPGPLYWAGICIGGGLTLLMGYVRLFVGSTRPDAETQMMVLTGLIIAFGGMTFITTAQLVRLQRQSIRWRGTTIVHQSGSGEVRRNFDEIAKLHKQPFGAFVVTFADGATLPIDPYATGAAELLERIERVQHGE